jgi:hypothetical protein
LQACLLTIWWLSTSEQTFAWWNMISAIMLLAKGQLKNSIMVMGNAVDGFE